MKKWDKLPDEFKNDEVRPYYEILSRRTGSLIVKRCSDFIAALVMTVIFLPFMLIIAVWIKCDSRGKVLFLQKRVTKYGRTFNIFKFRTMVSDAEKQGTQVTVKNDSRITRAGRFLRKCRLDVASIKFKDEEKLLDGAENADDVYKFYAITYLYYNWDDFHIQLNLADNPEFYMCRQQLYTIDRDNGTWKYKVYMDECTDERHEQIMKSIPDILAKANSWRPDIFYKKKDIC